MTTHFEEIWKMSKEMTMQDVDKIVTKVGKNAEKQKVEDGGGSENPPASGSPSPSDGDATQSATKGARCT